MRQALQRKIDNVIVAAALALAAIFAVYLTTPAAFAQSNVIGTALTSSARTVTTSSADIVNTSYRGVHVLINVTSFTSGTWTPTVEGKDPVSGTYYTICTGTVISGTGLTILKVYPGAYAQVENSPVCGDFVPRTWRVTVIGASTPSATFSVGYFGEF